MTLIVFSLGSAVVYGAADFFGGAASRRASARSVLLVSLPIGLVVLVVAAMATGTALSPRGVAWGLTGGLAGGTGLMVFYGALARGPMSVVAPVAALVSAVLPVAAGLLRGERPAPSVLIGVAICLVAICLVSMEAPRPAAESGTAGTGDTGYGRAWSRAARGPVLAALAGACFGVFFILLREAGRYSGLWALVVSRAAGLTVVIAVGLAGWALVRWGRPATAAPTVPTVPTALTAPTAPALPTAPASARRAGPLLSPSRLIPADRAVLLIAIASGILDSLANVLYVFATRAGMLSLAAVLTSMYPAITVLLARIVYCERLRVVQRLGILVALVGVALVAAG